MIQNLRRLIFGVPAGDIEAGRNAASRQALNETPMYLPASRLTDSQINAVGDDGDTWAPWRTDGFGEQWFRRTSAAVRGDQLPAAIQALAPVDDDGLSFDDSLPDDVAAGQLLLRQLVTDDYESPADASEAAENARLRLAARRYQNRMASWPMADDPGDDDIADADDSEGFDDE